jgi:hypothetical protein
MRWKYIVVGLGRKGWYMNGDLIAPKTAAAYEVLNLSELEGWELVGADGGNYFFKREAISSN